MRDFEGLDKSFADLHQRYLRLKQSSDSQQQVTLRACVCVCDMCPLPQHEKALKTKIARLEESCLRSEEKLRQLQTDATQQMNESAEASYNSTNLFLCVCVCPASTVSTRR